MPYHPAAVHGIAGRGDLHMRLAAGETARAAVLDGVRFLADEAGAEGFGRGHLVIVHLRLGMGVGKIAPPPALARDHLAHHQVGVGGVGVVEYGIHVPDGGVLPQSFAGHGTDNVLLIVKLRLEHPVVGGGDIQNFAVGYGGDAYRLTLAHVDSNGQIGEDVLASGARGDIAA